MTEPIRSLAEKYGTDLTIDQGNMFDEYMRLLIEWNQKMNLTAITDPEGITVKHFLDSLLVLKSVDIPEGAKLIDVGTGAGFPGIPLKIARQDTKLTLLDSLKKRLVFLEHTLSRIGLDAEIIHARAEETSRTPEYRETYDFVVSRAVSKLNILAEYCLPYLKPGGIFVAMKGFDIHDELEEAANAINVLGGRLAYVKRISLPDSIGRSLVVVKKTGETPHIYPRSNAKISKKPL